MFFLNIFFLCTDVAYNFIMCVVYTYPNKSKDMRYGVVVRKIYSLPTNVVFCIPSKHSDTRFDAALKHACFMPHFNTITSCYNRIRIIDGGFI